MIDETALEAAAIYDTLRERLATNPNIQDMLTITSLTEGQKGLVMTMLQAAISDGFRLGLQYGFDTLLSKRD